MDNSTPLHCRQALATGHTVTALVRSPAKLEHLAQAGLTVTQADIFDQAALAPHLAEQVQSRELVNYDATAQLYSQDAVLSCLGFPPQKPAVTGYLAATQAVVAAMNENGVTRLVLCHSW